MQTQWHVRGAWRFVILGAIGVTSGFLFGGVRLLIPGFIGTAGVFVLGLVVSPLVQWVGRLITAGHGTIRRPAPSLTAVLGITALLGFIVANNMLDVVEPRFRYNSVTSVPHQKDIETWFTKLVGCGGRWHAFGYRSAKGTDIYRDAVVWNSNSELGLKWEEPEPDLANRGGAPHPAVANATSRRAFAGAECIGMRTIAFGEDSSTAPSPDDYDGAIWVEDDDRWVLMKGSGELRGSGPQRVVGVHALKPPRWDRSSDLPSASFHDGGAHWRAILFLGQEQGARCLSSPDLRDWRVIGETAMKGWSVLQVVYADGRYIGLAQDPGAQAQFTLFSSKDCISWTETPLPTSIRSGASLTSINYAAGRWLVAGRVTHGEGRYAPLLLVGNDPSALEKVDLDDLASDKSSRAIYSIAENNGKLLALGYDTERSPSQQEDVAYPIVFERARAIKVPFRDRPLYHSSYKNVDLPEPPP
jgi:hypothetical protein